MRALAIPQPPDCAVPPPPPARTAPVAVTLLLLDGCPRTAAVRALLGGLGVAFDEVALARTHPAGDACGFVSPALRIASGARKGELLVQPSDAEILRALGRGRPAGGHAAPPDGVGARRARACAPC